MLFWLICAGLTLAAVAGALVPLARRSEHAGSTNLSDIDVYKDQLRELEQDAERGMIDREDAASARLEISRRVLKADIQEAAAPRGTQRSARIAVSAIVLVPVAAWAGYMASGSPQMPDQPIALRMNAPAENASIEVLLARTESHLAANPMDGKGWDVIAPVYLRLGQFEKAATAFNKSLEINGPSFKSEIGLAEALAGRNDGIIGPDSEDAYKRAALLEPDHPQPPVMLATAAAQRGDVETARSSFKEILAKAPKDAPWRSVVEQSLASLDSAKVQPGPSGADVEAAAGMSTGDRQAMIESMVAGLDAKLKSNPADKDGWLRLIRSYAVLGKPEKAVEALSAARSGLSADAAALTEVNKLASALGLETP